MRPLFPNCFHLCAWIVLFPKNTFIHEDIRTALLAPCFCDVHRYMRPFFTRDALLQERHWIRHSPLQLKLRVRY